MTDALFRQEVMEARQQRWLGDITLGQPVSAWLLGTLAFLAASAVVAFAICGDYTRRTRVTGQLVPGLGLASLTAPTSGTLVDVRVEEGQLVLAGDVLAVVAVPRATLAGGDTVTALQEALRRERAGIEGTYTAQRERLQAQWQGLSAQVAGTDAEARQARTELQTRRRQLAIAEQLLARLRGLHERKFAAEVDVQRQQAAVLDQLGLVQGIERQLLALNRLRAQLDQTRREIPAQLAALDASEQRDRAGVSQQSVELSSRAQAVIEAPVTGVVTTLLGQLGQSVQSGQPLMTLMPAASTLEAHLLVPSRAVGFVEPGDGVLLRYQAFPYQKFGHYGGRVVRISRSALTIGELGTLLGEATGGEPYYRIVVALDKATVRAFGAEERLRPGMLLEADILGEKRKLWEWAIEPLYSLSGSLQSR